MESTYMYIIYIVFVYISVSDPLNFDAEKENALKDIIFKTVFRHLWAYLFICIKKQIFFLKNMIYLFL